MIMVLMFYYDVNICIFQ